MKKLIFIFASLLLLVGCSGGVDVGNSKDRGPKREDNKNSSQVPQTNASMSYPDSWTSQTKKNILLIQNSNGSQITAKKSEITDLSSPNALSLEKYLEEKYPTRDYKIININGLDGVRAELVDKDDAKQSDIYLVSELKDFIHIESDLKQTDNGISIGEKIISTVKIEYKGFAYTNQKSKTVTLPPYDFKSENYLKAAYSFKDNCFSYVDENCYGVSVLFANGGGTRLDVGNAGYDHGRIVELGSDLVVPYNEIRIEGKYLVAPISKVPLADIYTVFTPKDPKQENDNIQLKAGYVYLVRTISWPEEDIITKMKVEKISADGSVTMTYSKLVYVHSDELNKQVDLVNKFTIENEMPLDTGEVMLFNRSKWNNYFFASFNFKYSNSGNMFITRNSWDLLFGNSPSKPTLDVPHTADGNGYVIDIGIKDLPAVTYEDFPEPDKINDSNKQALVMKGHTFIVFHKEQDEQPTYGVVRVIDIAPDASWIRLKFRRM